MVKMTPDAARLFQEENKHHVAAVFRAEEVPGAVEVLRMPIMEQLRLQRAVSGRIYRSMLYCNFQILNTLPAALRETTGLIGLPKVSVLPDLPYGAIAIHGVCAERGVVMLGEMFAELLQQAWEKSLMEQ
ncbi:MAG: hypothetical protein HOO67_03965 [Candidatus Peribacteraceae bacterium]|nr:hypothetical protein [Candidatus Peribacteraceae bacterium]